MAASKANSTPGRLSSIPTTTEAIADKPQSAKRISVLVLLRGVEKALTMTISIFDSESRLWLLDVLKSVCF